jgi:hypothetical protein
MRALGTAVFLLGFGFVAAGCSHDDNGGNGPDLSVGGDLSVNDGGGTGDGGGGIGGTGLTGTGTSCTGTSQCTGGQVCLGIGACACPPYQAYCSGQCIPVANDGQNCGGCGVTCTGTAACYGGKCIASGCPTGSGLMACSNACVDTQTDNDHCGNCTNKCDPTSTTAPTGCVGGVCVAIAGSTTGPGCSGGGPPITVSTPGGGTCAGVIASNTFTFALCSCAGISNSGSLQTDGFDSLKGPYPPGATWPAGLGAGVGANGSVSNGATMNVGGALFCSENATADSTADVRQELHVGANASPLAMTVGDDAYIHGTVAGNPLTINKTLYHPGGNTGVSGTTAAAIVNQPVTVLPPCDYCSGQQPGLIGVGSIVSARSGTNNDNASINLSSTLFSSGTGPSRLDLPCGNYYLDAISRDATIVAHGHVALYIGAGITAGNVNFTLDPTATFDIFVGGTITNGGTFQVGSQNYPALTRMYIAGGATPGSVSFSSVANIYGNLYYGAGRLTLSSGTTAFGAIYAGSVDGTADLTIHYDRQVVQQGLTCPPTGGSTDAGSSSAGGPCTTCKDCNNQACNGGTCGPCKTNADCCAPLTCINGTCTLPIQ